MLLAYSPTKTPARQAADRSVSGTINRLSRRLARLKQEYESDGWLQHHRDLSEHMMPRRGKFLCTGTAKGRQINRNIFTLAPVRSAQRCASGLYSGLTSKSSQWFNLTVEDRSIADIQSVRIWLSDCERLLGQWMDSSNLYSVLPELYLDLSVFGTAAMLVLEDYDKLFHCEMLNVGEYYLAQNKHRVNDTLYREYECTIDQMVESFGLENCSIEAQAKFKTGQLDCIVTVCHAIEPNRNALPGVPGSKNMPFCSIYWEKGSDKCDRFLRYQGYNENPLLAPRWAASNDTAYGRSPGMDALPECKQLKKEIEHKGRAFDRAIVPPMVAPAKLKQAGANLLPGALNYLSDVESASFRSVFDKYDPQIQYLLEDIKDRILFVEQAMYNDLFFAISNMPGKQPRNELEIYSRQAEMLQQLGAMSERFEMEFLEPLIDRIWAIAQRHGKLPPPPPEVQGRKIKVVFVGPLALAQKNKSVTAIERFVAFIGNMQRNLGFADAGDKLDTDKSIDEYGDLLNVPAALLRSDEDVAAIRQGRAEMQRQMAAAQAAPALRDVAQTAKLLSETRSGDSTGLEEVEGME